MSEPTQPQMTTATTVTPGREWKHPLLSLSDPLSFLISCIGCPCIVYSENMQKLHKKPSPLVDCLTYAVILDCGCYSCLGILTFNKGGSTRGDIRKKYGIQGSEAEDCLTHCCCVCCALSQEKMELTEVTAVVAPAMAVVTPDVVVESN